MAQQEHIIEPDSLDAGAVVPQCLDNVFVSNELFGHMVDSGTGLHEPEIVARREADTRSEYMRSLVYASQIVINRAFFWNNRVLYRDFERRLGNEQERAAFISLLRGGAIVPFLLKEASFHEDPPEFSTDSDGKRAMDALQEDIDTLSSLRLARDNALNHERVAALAGRFRFYFAGVGQLPLELVNRMASELFSSGPGNRSELSHDDLTGLRGRLREVVRHVNDSEDRPASRETLYGAFLCHPGTKVSDGRFLHPRDQRYVLELKKLFDLRYNTNLPDAIGRYTFSPSGLPGRSALCDEMIGGRPMHSPQVDRLLGDVLRNVRDTFMEGSQKAMTLPLLGKLKLSDVLQIRTELPSWKAFVDAQRAILLAPMQCLDLLPAFGKAFDDFQRELSDWYYRTYGRPASVERYTTFVTLGLKVGARLCALKFGADDLQKMPIEHADAMIPERVKGLAARLFVGVYDPAKGSLDRARSYSMDIWNDQREFTREEVRELFAKFNEQRISSEHIAGEAQLANSGRDGVAA